MSASPLTRQACSMQIPSKRIMLNDASDLPDVYSSTPNGTMYSTTPGGTRIIYERAFLMNLKNSPLSHTPPKNNNNIPNGLLRGSTTTSHSRPICTKQTNKSVHSRSPPHVEVDQFDMDI